MPERRRTNWRLRSRKRTYEQVVYYQGRTLVYDGKRYVEETELAHRVRLWLVNKNERHDNQTVSNVVADLQAIYLQSVRQFPSLPFYVGNGRNSVIMSSTTTTACSTLSSTSTARSHWSPTRNDGFQHSSFPMRLMKMRPPQRGRRF